MSLTETVRALCEEYGARCEIVATECFGDRVTEVEVEITVPHGVDADALEARIDRAIRAVPAWP